MGCRRSGRRRPVWRRRLAHPAGVGGRGGEGGAGAGGAQCGAVRGAGACDGRWRAEDSCAPRGGGASGFRRCRDGACDSGGDGVARALGRGYSMGDAVGEGIFDGWPEECGVFGVWHPRNAAVVTNYALYALQPRGQEGAGIAVVDGAHMRHHRGMGLVSEVFSADDIAALPGHAAAGHVRYSTTGSSTLANAQPQIFAFRQGNLAIAHNGNLINAEQLHSELEQQGSIFQSTSDTEVVAHLIARAGSADFIESVRTSMSSIQGGYAMVLLTNERLIALRDPNGLRPMALGQLDGAFVVASETCAFDTIGATFIQPSQQQRQSGVALKFNAVRKVMEGKRVVLVDDSIVRGTTSARLVSLVRSAGATAVHMRISSPPVTHPCFYGIDTSDRTKLIAAQLSVPGIQQLIGADTLGYLTEEQLLSAFGVTDMQHHSFCNACFTGRYPTALYQSMEKDMLAKTRKLVLR